jgi:hypothetical protein
MVLDVIRHLESTGYVIRRSQATPINDGAPRIHLARITETVTARDGNEIGIGKAELRQVFGVAGEDTTMQEFPVVEPAEVFVHTLATSEQAVNTYSYLIREYATGKWFAIPAEGRKPDLTGIVTAGAGAFREPTGAGPFTISDVTGIDAIWTGDSTIENVTNPLDKKLWIGTDSYQTKDCRVWMRWNVTSEQYEIYSATENRVVHSVNREDCEFIENDGEQGEHTWERGHEANWVQSIEQVGCDLQYTDACDNEFPILDLSQFVTGIFMSGDCLKYWKCGGILDGIATGLCFGECDDPPPCDGQYVIYECQLNSGVYSWEPISGPGCTSPCTDGPIITEPANAANLGRQIRVDCVP